MQLLNLFSRLFICLTIVSKPEHNSFYLLSANKPPINLRGIITLALASRICLLRYQIVQESQTLLEKLEV